MKKCYLVKDKHCLIPPLKPEGFDEVKGDRGMSKKT